ncbi:MAG: hypothetical protein M3Y41_22060 [Pseudomonadota bacterium]|nr:hypothetical protein [Pseudomonadota bacterium]
MTKHIVNCGSISSRQGSPASHMGKIGDPIQLATEIRNGANKTNLMFSS